MTDRGADRDGLDAAETPEGLPTEGAEGEGSVTVVGTAHVSPDSVAEVEETIDRERPDVVAVELDESRYRQLKGETPEDLEAGDVLRGNTVYQFLAYWLLSYVQTRLGDRFDIEPGADMMAAVDTAEELGLGVALVDRDIQETVRRLWGRMRLREKLKLFGSVVVELGNPWSVGLGIGFFLGFMVALIGGALVGQFVLPTGVASGVGVPLVGSLVGGIVSILDGLLVATGIAVVVGAPIALLLSWLGSDADVEEIDLENLTDADVVTAMIEEFRRFSPGGAEALIDERDAYIAHRLIALRQAGFDVVAVVGAGHREGIEGYLANPDDLPTPESLVGEQDGRQLSSLFYKGLGYLFTLGFLVFFVLLAMAGVRQTWLLSLFVAWFLVNGIVALALARLAGAHWTSAGAGGAVAWFTSVNPLIAPGWIAGYVELRYLDVNVADIGRLNELLGDEESPILNVLADMREVPLFRLILIVAATNIGSFLASLFFVAVILPYMSAPVGGLGGISDQMLAGARNSAELLWELVTGVN